MPIWVTAWRCGRRRESTTGSSSRCQRRLQWSASASDRMFSANTSGGFSVDYLTLRHAGMSKKRSTRRVLGLSALEYAVLAPAVALCGVLLFLGIGGSASGSVALPWLAVIPGAFVSMSTWRRQHETRGPERGQGVASCLSDHLRVRGVRDKTCTEIASSRTTMRVPSIRMIACQGITVWRSWERIPRWESHALGPTQRPVTRSLLSVSSPLRSWQRPRARPDSRLHLAPLERGECSHLSAPGIFSRYGRRRSSPAPRPSDVGVVLEADGRVDLLDLPPVDSDFAPAADPAG